MKEKNKVYTEFFKRERGKMISFVSSLVSDLSDRDSEDIVQDVMLNVWDLSDVTVPLDRLSSYVFRSLRNRVIDVLRSRKNDISLDSAVNNSEEISLHDLLSDLRYDTATEAEKSDIRKDLFEAIDSLNEEEKFIVVSTELEGQRFSELALRMNEPLGTLLSRKSRAMKKIRGWLDPLEYDLE